MRVGESMEPMEEVPLEEVRIGEISAWLTESKPIQLTQFWFPGLTISNC